MVIWLIGKLVTSTALSTRICLMVTQLSGWLKVTSTSLSTSIWLIGYWLIEEINKVLVIFGHEGAVNHLVMERETAFACRKIGGVVSVFGGAGPLFVPGDEVCLRCPLF